MKITHCISSIDESTGGPARSATHLTEALSKNKQIAKITLFTLESNNPLILNSSIPKMTLDFSKRSFFNLSRELSHKLKEIDSHLFHGHGIWEPSIHQMASISNTRNIPYIISIRGMLEPWSLLQSKWKKKIAMQLFQDKDLKNASCLHATALMEVESIRKLGYKNPIANIPNGINIEEFTKKKCSLINERERKILFLSRIHPKKGIENLILAWKDIDSQLKENWIVEIAGNGSKDYIETLNALILKNNLQNQVFIVGSKFGKDKLDAYQNADLFVLPTYSENFGIVIAEALCCGVPVITTNGAPWSEIETHDAGRWVAIGQEPLKIALVELIGKSDAERYAMGSRGRDLIVNNYSIDAVALKMVQLYDWIINGGIEPEFIIL